VLLEFKENLGTFDLIYPDLIPKPTRDPFHLVNFMMESPLALKARSILDIGTGTGIIPLLVAGRTASGDIIGVEIDALSARYAKENAKRNGLACRIKIINKDFRELPDKSNKGFYDIIVSNPPYIKKGDGRKSADKRRMTARHEERGSLKELVNVSDYLLSRAGRLFLILPTSRYAELMDELESIGFKAVRVKGLYEDKLKKNCKLFMIETRRG